MSNNHYIAIMAGGIGSRFWPSSTEERPKQFLDILGIGKSLIRLTFERCLKVVPLENVLIVTNKRYKDLVSEHLPELPIENILCEPSRNNTGPCVAYTALHIKAKNPNACFAVLPSDHIILKEEKYAVILKESLEFAARNKAIVTIGIQPTRPDTGYGYIEVTDKSSSHEPSFLKVNSFKEKPNHATAESYLESGNYLWNAGMFIWSIETVLSSFKVNEPQIIDVLTTDKSKFGTPDEQAYIDEVYPKTKSISVDYAIMERADNVYTIPADIGWSDLGTWNSLHAYKDKDQNQCVVVGDRTLLIDTKNTIVRSDSEKVAVIKGLDDYIVVDEKEALLIYPKSDEQEIKEIVRNLK